jgi:glycosyltransferase involved in cell wall biosynthesis
VKNILFLARWFYPHIGGVETHLLKISQILTSLGHQVTILNTNPNSNLSPKAHITNIQIFRISLPPKSSSNEKYIVWKWLHQHRRLISSADIIHCHDVFFWYLPFRFIFPRKPVFVTFHGHEGHYPISPKAIRTRNISEILSRGNICVGKFIAKWYKTKPDFITYGGVDIPSQSRVNQQSNLCLFLGRLSSDTGLQNFIKALKQYNHGHPKHKLHALFLGDGPLRSQARSVGRVLGFQPSISRHLFQSRMIFASGHLSILEAMVHSRLVFTSYDNPLRRDYLKMTPFSKFINIANSPQQLANQLHHYFNHPKKEKHKISTAYNWVKHQSWEKVTDMYLKLWKL